MQLLQVGSTGLDVQKWEWFLTGQGLSPGKDDGIFDSDTKAATIAFQQKWSLGFDGAVGRETWAKAVALGFGVIEDGSSDKTGPGWPPRPAFEHLSDVARVTTFGAFEYHASPTPGNPEGITILGDWEEKNIVRVHIPQLLGIPGAPHDGVVRFHHLVAQQFMDLFQAWDDAGLKHLILSWEGSYFPRFIRGSTTRLSNHSYGSAADMNLAWNALGAEPALVGRQGSMRELVPIMGDHGIFWGGFFIRLDGMHGEAAQIKS
jgi:hypothetical protein